MPTPSLLSLPIAIVQHTPLWVWPLLACVIFMGLRATRERTMRLFQPLIVPLIFLTISLTSGSMLGHGVFALLWAIGFGCGALAGLWLANRLAMQVLPDRRLRLGGQWLTLWLSLTIFISHFAFSVLAAVAPTVLDLLQVGGALSLLVGLCSGLFLGRGGGIVLRALREEGRYAPTLR